MSAATHEEHHLQVWIHIMATTQPMCNEYKLRHELCLPLHGAVRNT